MTGQGHLIDFHCHMNELSDVRSAIASAKEQNVKHFLSNSVDLSSNKKNAELGKQYSEITPLIGFHPGDLLRKSESEIDETMEWIQKNISKFSGIGEIGLDFIQAENKEEKDLQHRIFGELIDLGISKNKTIVVHSRGARDAVLDQLSSHHSENVILHWFYGNQSQMKIVLEHGWKVTLGPSILDQSSLKKMILSLPLENIALETDCPVPFNGIPSQPSWVRKVAEKVCEIKGLSIEEMQDNCLAIFKDLF